MHTAIIFNIVNYGDIARVSTSKPCDDIIYKRQTGLTRLKENASGKMCWLNHTVLSE